MKNVKWKMENLVPPSQPANFLSLCHIQDRSNFLQLLPRGGADLMGPRLVWTQRRTPDIPNFPLYGYILTSASKSKLTMGLSNG
jgi:hypothetical protein